MSNKGWKKRVLDEDEKVFDEKTRNNETRAKEAKWTVRIENYAG